MSTCSGAHRPEPAPRRSGAFATERVRSACALCELRARACTWVCRGHCAQVRACARSCVRAFVRACVCVHVRVRACACVCACVR
eukprot:5776818-Pleurochrysis_carterae.AAC.1